MNALLSLALLLPAAPVPKQQQLQWKLAKGDIFYVKTSTETQSVVNIMGQGQNQKHDQTITMYSKFAVTDVSDTGYIIEQTIEKVEMAEYATVTEEAVKLFKDVRLTYETDIGFEIKKLKGVDDFIDKVSKGDSATKAQMKRMLNEESMHMGFNEVFEPGPQKAVIVGDRWTRKTKYSLGPLGAFHLDRDYKYLNADTNDKVSYTAKAKYVANAEADALFKITEGEFKAERWDGEYVFDSIAGRLKTSKTSMKLNGDITIGAGGQNLKMVMVMDVKMETTVSDKSLVKAK